MNGITVLMKKIQEHSHTSSATCGHSKEMAIYEPGSESSPDTENCQHRDQGFPASRTLSSKCLLFTKGKKSWPRSGPSIGSLVRRWRGSEG